MTQQFLFSIYPKTHKFYSEMISFTRKINNALIILGTFTKDSLLLALRKYRAQKQKIFLERNVYIVTALETFFT